MTLYNKYFTDFKDNYIMNMALTIILQSCLGSIAAMFILMNSTADNFLFIQLSLCVIVAMAYNAAIMAQLSKKLIFNLLIISLVVNFILIAINIAQL